MFNVTNNRGFHITFANGWTVSVQWGRGNYCDNRTPLPPRIHEPVPPSPTAEIAAWDHAGRWWQFENDTVAGYQTPEQVAEFIQKISQLKREHFNETPQVNND